MSKIVRKKLIGDNQLVVVMAWEDEDVEEAGPEEKVDHEKQTRSGKHKISPYYAPQALYCKYCDKDFTRKKTVDRHKCLSEFRSYCPFCYKTFKNPSVSLRHEKSVHGAKMKCDKCNKKFTRKDNKIRHMRNSCKR